MADVMGRVIQGALALSADPETARAPKLVCPYGLSLCLRKIGLLLYTCLLNLWICKWALL